MKIHAAVRLDDEVYLPGNDEHAAMLADTLSARQRDRLRDAGIISGPGAGEPVVVEDAPVKKQTTRQRPAANKPPVTKAPSKKNKKTPKKKEEGSTPWNDDS